MRVFAILSAAIVALSLASASYARAEIWDKSLTTRDFKRLAKSCAEHAASADWAGTKVFETTMARVNLDGTCFELSGFCEVYKVEGSVKARSGFWDERAVDASKCDLWTIIFGASDGVWTEIFPERRPEDWREVH